MDVLFLIGRILFVGIFLGSAMGHLRNTDAMAGYAESRGVKPARPLTLITGVQIAVGALLVLLGIWIDVGLILLALFLIPTAVLMHAFWKETDAMAKQMEQIQFMKDLALAGASIALLAAVWMLGGDLDLTITDPLFNP
ncbi:MAG TPA: DoxX family protein [Jiangellaceae bacterium]